MADEKLNEKETTPTTTEAEPANDEKAGGLGEKQEIAEAEQQGAEREKAATKGRSKSPTKTVNTTSSRHTNSNHGHHGRDASNATSANTHRNRVSVGSRVSRVVVVRPPYAARDELDFERRPRSNTAGTVTGAGNGQGSRHLGIQPTLHATKPSEQVSDSKQSRPAGPNPDVQSADTPDQQFTPQQNGDNTGQDQEGSLTRPSNPNRLPSNDASRWLAFTIPTRYRKRYDDYMAQRAKEQEEEDRRRRMGESALDSSSADSEASSYYTDSEEEGADGVRQHSRRRKKPKRGGSNPKKTNQYVRGAKPSGRKGEYPAQTDEEADIGRYLSTRPVHGTSRRSSRRKEHKHGNMANGDIPETPEQRHSRSSSFNRHTMNARIDTALSANQTGTPGWNTPWRPDGGRRGSRPVNVIHRVQSDIGFEGLGMSHARLNHDSGQAGPGQDQQKKKNKKRTRLSQWQSWLVRSAFAPLIFRLLNVAFTASILGIAVNIHRVAHRNGVDGIMGSSTLYAIIIMPLSLVHIFFNVYAEYFGPPIGVWKVRGKMLYTFTELIFISLWSGLLSLSFDDLFTSAAGCTSFTPNAQFNQVAIGSSSANGSIADRLCDNQTALIALVFVGMILYILVLIVSLFRIFAKISRFN